MKVNPAMLAGRMGRGLASSVQAVTESQAQQAALEQLTVLELLDLGDSLADQQFDLGQPAKQPFLPQRHFMLVVKTWRQFHAWSIYEFTNGEVREIEFGCVEILNSKARAELIYLIANRVKQEIGEDRAFLRLSFEDGELKEQIAATLADDPQLLTIKKRKCKSGSHAAVALAKAEAQCAAALIKLANPNRLVYTDGSHRKASREGSAAWVDTDGGFWLEAMKSSNVMDLEIAAICNAIISSGKVVTSVTIKTDSQPAMDVVNKLLKNRPLPQMSTRTRDRLESLRNFLATRNNLQVNIVWVRGHSGDPLNDLADRLALLARRLQDAGLSREELLRRAQVIVEEFFQHHAANIPNFEAASISAHAAESQAEMELEQTLVYRAAMCLAHLCGMWGADYRYFGSIAPFTDPIYFTNSFTELFGTDIDKVFDSQYVNGVFGEKRWAFTAAKNREGEDLGARLYYDHDCDLYYLVHPPTRPDNQTDQITNELTMAGQGIPDKFQQAAQLMSHVKPEFRNKVVLAGHSLGGGIAAFAALNARQYSFTPPTFAFDPLGLNADMISAASSLNDDKQINNLDWYPLDGSWVPPLNQAHGLSAVGHIWDLPLDPRWADGHHDTHALENVLYGLRWRWSHDAAWQERQIALTRQYGIVPGGG